MKPNKIVVTYYPKYEKLARSICEHLKRTYKMISLCFNIELVNMPRDDRFDLTISVGGDGTFIKSASMFESEMTMGIKASNSSVGYHCSSDMKDYKQHLKMFMSGKFKTNDYFGLKSKIGSNNLPRIISSNLPCAFNEVLLTREHVGEMFNYELSVENELYPGRSTGVIIYTPAGSTAHAKSAGGARLSLDLEVTGVVPESQFIGDLKNMIVPSKKEIRVKSKDSGYVIIDGWFKHRLNPGDEIRISKGRKIKVVRFD
jgi:NAD+ kinase